MDEVDACLVDCSSRTPRLLATHSRPFPPELAATIRELADNRHPDPMRACGETDARLGTLFGKTVNQLLSHSGIPADEITAIGSHGQTLFHHPEGQPPFTWQIGDPNRIAWRTGIPVVADFRRMDVAAGGQGAPLVPPFHQACLGDDEEYRAVLNIGGIANVTLLPPGGSVRGFDTGPGNTLMDGWIRQHQDRPFDADGEWAASGTSDDRLVARWLGDPYFRRPIPKSTGPEHFSLEWLSRLAGTDLDRLDPADVQASLLALTADSIANDLREHAPDLQRLLVCGGGNHNAALMAALEQQLAPLPVDTTDAHGVPADWMEAMAFAWLARRRWHGLPGNLPSATGAERPVLLGAVYRP